MGEPFFRTKVGQTSTRNVANVRSAWPYAYMCTIDSAIVVKMPSHAFGNALLF